MRFGVVLVVVFAFAAGIGVWRAHSDPLKLAAPTAVVLATPTPNPLPGVVLMQPGGGSDNGGHYVPPSVTIHVGQHVTFYDNDTKSHSATAADGSFDTGILSPGQAKVIPFRKAGTYPFSDIMHSDMNGVVHVAP
jgi:plastocyanin